VGHLAASSNTLEDGTTPNPFDTIAAQNSDSTQIVGPSYDSTPFLGNTSLGAGNAGFQKWEPYGAGTFVDRMFIEPCNCAESWVFLYVSIVSDATVIAGSTNMYFGIRRIIEKTEWNTTAIPSNTNSTQGFN